MEEESGDEQWELVAPLLPKHKRRGRPRLEDLPRNCGSKSAD
jgi:transposase